MNKAIILFCAIIALAASCIAESGTSDGGIRKVNIFIEEDLRVGNGHSTKGYVSDILCKDEFGIGHLQAIAYDMNTGRYFTSASFANAAIEDISLELPEREFAILLLANMPKIVPPADLQQMKEYAVTVTSAVELCDSNGYLPMCGESTVGAKDKSINIRITRSIAEVSVNCLLSEGITFEASSVRLRSVPGSYRPFGNSKTLEWSESEGDYATGQDLESFNTGGKVRLFMPENPRGSGSPGEESLIGQDAGQPPLGTTWLEIEGNVTNSAGLITANIMYRVALDFPIERNKRYGISFTLTENGIAEGSWRVAVTDGILDMGIDKLTLSVGSTYLLTIPAEDYMRIEYTSSAPDIVTVSEIGTIRALKTGTAYIHAHAAEIDAQGSMHVTVTEDGVERVDIPQYTKITMGIARKINFFANYGRYFRVQTPHGMLSMQLPYLPDGDIMTQEDDSMRIIFDPRQDPDKTREITVVYKNPTGDRSEIFSGMLTSKRLKQEFDLLCSTPQMKINPQQITLCESGQSAFFKIEYYDNDRKIDIGEFEKDVFDACLNRITPATEQSEHFGFTGIKDLSGMVYAKKSCEGEVTFAVKSQGTYGIGDNGKASMKLRITPAFEQDNDGTVSIDNNIYISENGHWSETLAISEHNLRDAHVEFVHLRWDRNPAAGTAASANEISGISFINGGISFELGPDASGPYAVKVTKTNAFTGQKFIRYYYTDITVNLDAGVHFKFNEVKQTTLDATTVFNLNEDVRSRSGILSLLEIEDREYFYVTEKYMMKGPKTYCSGVRLRDWDPGWQFIEISPDLPMCENFLSSMTLKYDTPEFVCKLYDPYSRKVMNERKLEIAEEISNSHFGGKAVMFRIRFNNFIYYTIYHSGCGWFTGYPEGYVESNILFHLD